MITNSMGAKKVEGTDNWREIFDAHNDTADALEQMGQDVAPIVNGNKSVTGAASGEYVLVRNSSITGITDGAYKAAQAIPANTAIDSTYLTAITGGALNDLNSKIDTAATAYMLLQGWSGNSSATVSPYNNRNIFDYDMVTFLLEDSDGSTIVATATVSPNATNFKGVTFKIYGSSSSQWMSFCINSNGTITLNRTSSNTSRIYCYGIKHG